MINVTVYFHGPSTNWDGRIAEGEIIARFDVPYMLLARWKVKALMAQLNTGRCGYFMHRQGVEIDRSEAPNIELLP